MRNGVPTELLAPSLAGAILDTTKLPPVAVGRAALAKGDWPDFFQTFNLTGLAPGSAVSLRVEVHPKRWQVALSSAPGQHCFVYLGPSASGNPLPLAAGGKLKVDVRTDALTIVNVGTANLDGLAWATTDIEFDITPGSALEVIASAGTITAPATGTTTSVGDSATVVTLLAANAARVGATVYNDSTAILRLKMGAAASGASFSAVLAGKVGTTQPGGYWEAPYGYTGVITGIWDSDAGGNALVTEITP